MVEFTTPETLAEEAIEARLLDEALRPLPATIRGVIYLKLRDDPALANRRIVGTFDSFDPEALVRFLGKYGDATITETETDWTVSTAGPQAANK